MFCRISGNADSPAVALPRLADRAGRRVGPERLVVGAPVVVAGQPEEPREGQDQERGREDQPARPPGRLGTEPRVGRAAEQLGGVERREVRAPGVVLALEGGPGRVDDEGGQNEEHDDRLHPPAVGAQRLAEAAWNHRELRMPHRGRLPSERKWECGASRPAGIFERERVVCQCRVSMAWRVSCPSGHLPYQVRPRCSGTAQPRSLSAACWRFRHAPRSTRKSLRGSTSSPTAGSRW